MGTEDIKKVIEKAVPRSQVFVLDPNSDGQHFQAFVVSPVFEGMMLVKQHQMVMQSLKSAFAESVHALQLKTFTPKKWQESKHQFNILED